MKIKDFISKYIQTYPSLFKSNNYEESKLKVLNHAFFVIGNGIELSETENPKEGGYLVSPKYREDKKTGNRIRIVDIPYGLEKFDDIPSDYFETHIFGILSLHNPLEIKTNKCNMGGYDCIIRFDKETVKNDFFYPTLYEIINDKPFTPYPFSVDFSFVCKIFYKQIFIQEDWMNELVILCKRTLDFFEDNDQVKNDTCYPNDNKIKNNYKRLKEVFEKDGEKGVYNLRKELHYPASYKKPTLKEVRANEIELFNNYKSEKIIFLKQFLSVYSK